VVYLCSGPINTSSITIATLTATSTPTTTSKLQPPPRDFNHHLDCHLDIDSLPITTDNHDKRGLGYKKRRVFMNEEDQGCGISKEWEGRMWSISRCVLVTTTRGWPSSFEPRIRTDRAAHAHALPRFLLFHQFLPFHQQQCPSTMASPPHSRWHIFTPSLRF